MHHHYRAPEKRQRTKHGEMRQYLQDLACIPALSYGAEQHLLQQIADAPHSASAHTARNTLIESHLSLVVELVQAYLPLGGSFPDLVQEGNFALIQVVQSFDLRHHRSVWEIARCAVLEAIKLAIAEEMQIPEQDHLLEEESIGHLCEDTSGIHHSFLGKCHNLQRMRPGFLLMS